MVINLKLCLCRLLMIVGSVCCVVLWDEYIVWSKMIDLFLVFLMMWLVINFGLVVGVGLFLGLRDYMMVVIFI